MIRQFGGARGIVEQPQGLDLGLGGSNIKSIQSGQTTMTAATVNVTISAVDISKSIVILSVFSNIGENSYTYFFAPVSNLTTPTNLRLDIYLYSASWRPTVVWQVIEFNNVKSRQYGQTTATTTQTNVTISSVDVLKSIVIVQSEGGTTGSYASYYTAGIAGAWLSSSTNLVVMGGAGPTDKIVQWQVIEFF